MKRYTLVPIDWDYSKEEIVREYSEKGICTPCQIQELVDMCGSLFPFITTKTAAIKYAKEVKKQFSFVIIGLFEGDNWGDQETVKEF